MRRRVIFPLLIACLLLAALTPYAQAADLHPFDLPSGFTQEVLAQDLGPATAFAFRPDGSILIARKHGSVKVWRDGKVLEAPFLDISDQVNRYGDRGLMGIAVHPTYPQPAYVYLSYAYEPEAAQGHAESGARTGRVVRVEVDARRPDQARQASMVVLLGKNGEGVGNLDRGDRPPYSCMGGDGSVSAAPLADCLPVDGPSHTVDGLVFGPDGALYVSVGDGTLQPDLNARAQNLDSLAGKVLRVNPISGAGYRDNPFYDGNPNSNRSKVYALGLRNPYRFTFDPAGQLVVGDVGGERWEEINRGAAGANFGWPCLEGPLPNSGDAACASVLNGSAPATAAFYGYAHSDGYSAAIGGDFYTGDQYPDAYQGAYFFADHNRAALLYLPAGAGADAEAQVFATNVIAPVQISQGPDGMLYVLSFVDGALSRIRYTGEGAASTADEAGDEATPPADEAAAIVEPEATAPGSAPHVTILAPADGSAWPVDALVDLRGEAVDAEDGALAGDSLVWSATLLHNEHVHPDFFHGTDGGEQLLFEEHGPNTQLEVCLTATDSDGQSGSACVILHQCGVEGEPCEALATGIGTDEGDGGSARHDEGEGDGGSAAHDAGEGDEGSAHADADEGDGGAAWHSGEAGVLREVWGDVGGAAVAEWVAEDGMAAPVDFSEVLPALETAGYGKDYAQRLSGYLLPPVSGDYQFWIAADDSGELWLSTDADPAHAVLIAQTTTWTRRNEWDKEPSQASAPIPLEAGQRYYIEVRHKQADQKDNVAVAWQPPGEERGVISGEFLRR